MTETAIKPTVEPELDEDLLAEAMRGVGTLSRNATLNAVLREYVEAKRASRLQAYDSLQQLAAEGAFDFDALDEAER